MQISLHSEQDLPHLREKVRQEGNAKQRDRYRAVLLALEGYPTKTIMQMLDRSKNFVQRWAYAYRDGGVDAIAARSPSGRPAKLTKYQEHQFRQRLLEGPQPEDGVCSLRGKDVRRIIEQEFGVQYSLPGVYDLLHRLGFSSLQPRPKHRKNNPHVMQAWLEEAPLLSKASETHDPTKP